MGHRFDECRNRKQCHYRFHAFTDDTQLRIWTKYVRTILGTEAPDSPFPQNTRAIFSLYHDQQCICWVAFANQMLYTNRLGQLVVPLMARELMESEQVYNANGIQPDVLITLVHQFRIWAQGQAAITARTSRAGQSSAAKAGGRLLKAAEATSCSRTHQQ